MIWDACMPHREAQAKENFLVLLLYFLLFFSGAGHGRAADAAGAGAGGQVPHVLQGEPAVLRHDRAVAVPPVPGHASLISIAIKYQSKRNDFVYLHSILCTYIL